VAASGGEVLACGEEWRYFVVRGGEMGVDDMTHVEIYPHHFIHIANESALDSVLGVVAPDTGSSAVMSFFIPKFDRFYNLA